MKTILKSFFLIFICQVSFKMKNRKPLHGQFKMNQRCRQRLCINLNSKPELLLAVKVFFDILWKAKDTLLVS
jgi:hypothetical protein